MARPLAADAARRNDDHRAREIDLRIATRQCATVKRRFIMTWQTPTATDVRLGFEITMYVSAR